MERGAPERLKLLPYSAYPGVKPDSDPIRFYYWPVLGRLYRRRVELCLHECRGGERVLEVGFGSGVTFPTLSHRYREIWGLDLGAPVDEIMESFRGMGIETHLKNGSVLDTKYPDGWFDTVLLVSILEHLKPTEQRRAFSELKRILKPGGQIVYGVPVERGLMVFTFRMMGIDIREHHFSTEVDVANVAASVLSAVSRRQLSFPVLGAVYEVGHYVKSLEPA